MSQKYNLDDFKKELNEKIHELNEKIQERYIQNILIQMKKNS